MSVDRSGSVGSGGVSHQGVSRIPQRCENTDFPWLVGNLEKFSPAQQKEFHALADTFFSSESQFMDRVFQQISARKRELGKPLSRSEARELYLHAMVGIFSHSHASFIDALDRALDRAETAGNLRASEPAFLSRAWKRVRDRVIGPNPFSKQSPNVALDLLPPPTKKEARPNENGPKTIVVLMPQMFSDKKASTAYIQELRASNPDVYIIGDGFSNFSEESFQLTQKAHPEAQIHLFGHGGKTSEVYTLLLGPYVMPTEDVFLYLKEFLGEQFVGTVHVYACYSESALALAHALPNRASLVLYSDKEVGVSSFIFQKIKENVASSVRFSGFLYADTVIFRDNGRKLMCSIPLSPLPPRTPAEFAAYVQTALMGCKNPEIVAAANRMKVSDAQLRRYWQEAFVSHVLKGNILSAQAYLDKRGVDLNGRFPDGATALLMAAASNKERSVEWLLSRPGIEIDKPQHDNQITPLAIAAWKGHTSLVRLLLLHGANPNARVKKTRASALMMAVENGHDEVVRTLLADSRTQVDAQASKGQNALIVAAQGGREELLRLLLEKGANPTHARKDGVTALDLAIQLQHLSVARMLLADPRVDPNFTKALDGAGPLHCALDLRNLTLIEMILLNLRTDPNLKRKDGVSPLFQAIELNPPEMAEKAVALFHRNARTDFTLEARDVTPLIRAVQLGHVGVVQEILSYRDTKPNQGNSEGGITALHAAAYLEKPEMVRLLIADQRVDLEPRMTKDSYATPLDLARRRGNRAITALLEDAIARRKLLGASPGSANTRQH